MADETAISRTSFFAAGCLGLLGLARLGSDYLTDIDPHWIDVLGHRWLRHLMRTASDGSIVADCNVQLFKILAVPCGIAVAYYLHLVIAGSLRAADYHWHTLRIRAVYIGSLLLLCTFIEVEKATHLFGLGLAGLLRGEVAWKNHVVHVASAALGWLLMSHLRYRKEGA